jgi:S-DNA-T family DNA segregation ATPase FtsK/SpoIIIE
MFKVHAEDEYMNDWIEEKDAPAEPKKSNNTSENGQGAKVLYQYPKGNFRFPLIPDEELYKSRERSTSPNQESVVSIESNQRMSRRAERASSIKQPVKEPESHQVSTQNRDSSNELPRTRNEEKAAIGKRRPFRPTEIPSPIYGYSRPKPKPTVEFELTETPFRIKNSNETVVNNQGDPLLMEGMKETPIVPKQMDRSLSRLLEVAEIDDQKDKTVEETSIDELGLKWEEQADHPKPDDTDLPTVENEAPIFEYNVVHREDSLTSNEVKEVENQEDQIVTRPDDYSSHKEIEHPTENDKFYFEADETEDIFSKEEDVNDHEKEETDRSEEAFMLMGYSAEVAVTTEIALQEDLVELENTNESSSKLIVLEGEEESASMTVEQEREEEFVSIILDQEDEEVADTDSKEETPRERRRNIPFNVIMLKQDKQKLAQKKATLAEQHVAPYTQARSVAEGMEEMPHSQHLTQEREESKESPQQLNLGPEKFNESFDDMLIQEQLESNELMVENQLGAPPRESIFYEHPSFELLNPPVFKEADEEWINGQKELLNQTLVNFNVNAEVVNVTQGPSVTRFEVQPAPGVKVNKITNLSDDLKLSLAARDIRIEAPIPGKHTIGIEVPNQSSRPVLLSEIIGSEEFKDHESPLAAALGLDISGKPISIDLRKMPHGLIAGATGSGKSVCINSILVSLLYKATPEELRLLLIDPKMVELAPYNHIPHLVSPVITDVKAATAALKWAVDEMERRYELFAHTGVRDISRFNELAMKHNRYSDKLPYIVIIIDELADLMMMSPADVEEAICRIAQKARACGIHLIIATQRPSVDVITGLIKANVPTRIAFSVSSQVDSRTIIDIGGAEKLLGRGDMLFLENGSSKAVRLQGTYVADEEIDDVVAHVRDQRQPDYLFQQEELLKKSQVHEEEDELFFEACEFVVEQGGASTSSLQRRFKIGYNRAARLIDMMEEQGFISETRGSKPRDVLITEADLESIQDTSTII